PLVTGVQTCALPIWIPARHVWVERVVELIWRVLDPARRLRGWTGPPDALARAARPHPESLARDAMRWRPRGPRDFARGYFASLRSDGRRGGTVGRTT